MRRYGTRNMDGRGLVSEGMDDGWAREKRALVKLTLCDRS